MHHGKGDGNTRIRAVGKPDDSFFRERALLPTHGIQQPVKDGIHPPFY